MYITDDTMTPVGAALIAKEIEFFWRTKGVKPPKLRVEKHLQRVAKAADGSPHNHYSYSVRSDMIDGLPRSLWKDQADAK